MSLESPIIIIGAQRSGTTWMGACFSRHPRLAYWEEPRHVWTWGNGYAPDDVLTERDASPKITAHIRAEFERFVRDRAKDRLVEKTPSNCLRIRFIHAVFPEARLILLLRDGRSVLRSTAEIMRAGAPVGRIWRRAVETPLREWPAYAPRAVGTVYRRIIGKPLAFWGPRPPGWRDWVGADPEPVMLAKQWAGSVNRALDDAASLPQDHVVHLRYESIMERPRQELQRAVDAVRLADAGDVLDFAASTADPARAAKWRAELDDETLELVRPHMEPTLQRLGYQW